MEIIKYKHEKEKIEEYINFLKIHYSDDLRITGQLANTRKLLDIDNPFFEHGEICNYIIQEDGKTLGHCSAILDNRNKDIGLIGFYDCVKDEKVSGLLLDKCINWLRTKGCSKFRGPVNLTIWHNYRFISRCKRKPDLFDPFSKDYYIDFWKKKGFTNAGKYVSAVRQDFNYVIPYTKKAHDDLSGYGFRLRKFNKNSDDLKIILELANQIFAESWNFVPLSFEEFEYLYQDIMNNVDLSFIEIAEDKEKKPIGFCFSLPNPYNKEQIILKTIGVLPELRRQNIAGALLYSQHIRAKDEGFKEFYYPLIRVGNNVTKFPYEGYEIITEYEVFELS
ncbi:MAG: hypothetical protein MAG795_00239 [Candidatus Woesearchaeota archaeon]|nr:hypothetical protein [Candidatus Woesearchaeota archaeon]